MVMEEVTNKEAGVSQRAANWYSVMSYEDPVSPTTSNSSDSDSDSDDDDDSIAESYHRPSWSQGHPKHGLTRHVSHASFTSAVGGIPITQLERSRTNRSTATNATTDSAYEVDFEENDRGNPQNWSLWYKGLVVAVMSYATTCVVLYSTSYTAAIPGMQREWGITDNEGILGMTTYLIGIATGSVILAPLSEMYGRRPIYAIALGMFTVLVLPCALAPNIAAILATRFFGAFCAAAMISNAPGTVNDICDEEHRALAFSVWSVGPMNGPVIGPVVGGFVYQYLGWRWTNWVVMIMAGVAWVIVSLIPETYSPALLKARAAKKRKESGDERWWSRYDDKEEFWPLLKINLSRPFTMTFTEPILIFWDIYIALVYGILYLCFVAYPIVFTQQRGWSPGITGLAFVGIGVGSMTVIVCEPLIRKMINSHAEDPDTPGHPPPEAMVSIVCAAAISTTVGELWFAWTCTPNVHWVLPILAGIPFGAGNATVFIYGSNYLVHSYGIYAASALAGNAVLRSILGATLPLAGPAMYKALGSNWAGTLCGIVEAICIPIPFVFYRYGSKIRLKSPLIRSMQEDKRRMDAKRRKAEEKLAKRAEAEAVMGAGMGTGEAVEEEIDVQKDIEKGRLANETRC